MNAVWNNNADSMALRHTAYGIFLIALPTTYILYLYIYIDIYTWCCVLNHIFTALRHVYTLPARSALAGRVDTGHPLITHTKYTTTEATQPEDSDM
jgi:hypothetical protein